MPISGSENAWIRAVLLFVVGVVAILSLAGIVVLQAMGKEIPPVLAGALGGAMGSITTLLTPVRADMRPRVDPDDLARAFEHALNRHTFHARNPDEPLGPHP